MIASHIITRPPQVSTLLSTEVSTLVRFSTLVLRRHHVARPRFPHLSTLMEDTSVDTSVDRICLEKPPFFNPVYSFYSSKEKKRKREKKEGCEVLARFSRACVDITA